MTKHDITKERILAAAANPLEHTAELRLEQHHQHHNDGAGLEERVQQPAQRIQLQQLTGNRTQEQKAQALEHLVGSGLLGPDDQLI